MQKLIDIIPPTAPLNHAYIIIGESTASLSALKELLEQRFGPGFTSMSNPDFSVKEFSSWGVDESREVKGFNANRPSAWLAKVLVIMSPSITLQAQNSLLKTLEEPASDTHYFIISRTLGEYLPTVLSRCQIIRLDTGVFSSNLVDSVTEYLSADISRRFVINKDILAQQEDNVVYGLDWLNCLFEVYWGKVASLGDKRSLENAQALLKDINYANSRGSSLRLILDHVAGLF